MLEACSFEPLLSFILTYAAPWQHSTERHLTFTTHILIRFGYQTAIRAPRFIQLRFTITDKDCCTDHCRSHAVKN